VQWYEKATVAEGLVTLFLVAVVVGSGIIGETLVEGNSAVALLGNTIATSAILVVSIQIFDLASGAHFNQFI